MKVRSSSKSRGSQNAGTHGVHEKAAQGKQSTGQTPGQAARDPKGRKGQYGGAGDSPLTKK